MIDTDKYEGHTEGLWRFSDGTIWGGEGDNYISLALDVEGSYQPKDPVLMADAPLLLAEVKRLREGIADITSKWGRPSIIRGFIQDLQELIE
tara:strand:- start:542 stop:817 length:276 start_codon:yes stop_codon:yes gene_type:complete